MSATEFGTNDAQTVKRWSGKLCVEALGETYFSRFTGKSKASAIQVHGDLEDSAGDEIKYDLRETNRGPGVQGDATLKNYEAPLVYYQDNIKIDQLREAHEFRRMSQQRTVHDLRSDAKDSLKDWFARNYDCLWLAYGAGTTGNGEESTGIWQILNGSDGIAVDGDAGFAGNAMSAPDAAHVVDGSGGAFNLGLVDSAKTRAQTMNPKIRPIMVDGKPKYVMILHPNQVHAMRTSTSAGQWLEIHREADVRGGSNPIYTGALGEHNGVVLHSSEYIPRLDSSANGYSRFSVVTGTKANNLTFGLFMGAQAFSFAMGNAYDKMDRVSKKGGAYFSWNEDRDDYGNRKGCAASSVFGLKACTFNSKRYGSMVVQSVDAPPS